MAPFSEKVENHCSKRTILESIQSAISVESKFFVKFCVFTWFSYTRTYLFSWIARWKVFDFRKLKEYLFHLCSLSHTMEIYIQRFCCEINSFPCSSWPDWVLLQGSCQICCIVNKFQTATDISFIYLFANSQWWQAKAWRGH